jgi:3-oxoacyl-[acyl-carrier protein] reductase
MDAPLAGRVALVTGAGRGLGVAIAAALSDAGAAVACAARSPAAGAATARAIQAHGGSATVVMLDVTRAEQVTAAVNQTARALGAIDVLVNNAGLGGSAELHEMTDEQWNVVLDVTLNGTFRCMRAALNHMYANGRGVIVNNASVVGWRAQAEQAHYAAAKAGVMALTRCAAIEAGRRGVRVNAVAPSLAMHANLAKVTTDELLAELSAREAFGRPAEPWEVATVVAFLASDYSGYMTGEVVSVSSQHP